MFSQEPIGRLSAAIQRYGLPVFAGLVLALLWGVSLSLLTLQKQRLIEESRRELGFMNDAVAQHTAGVLRALESDLRVLDLWLQHHPDAKPLSDARLHAVADQMRRASGGLTDLRFVSAEGRLYPLPSGAGAPTPTDVSDREYFMAQQNLPPAAEPSPLHIGAPVKSRVSGRWVIPLSLRLTRPVDGFSMLVAVIELEHITAFHEGMRFRPEGTIVLMRKDGTVLSRTPFNEQLMGRNASKTPMFVNEYGHTPRGSFLSDGVVSDGVPRVVSYRHLDSHPVIVLVTREIDKVLSQYLTRRPMILGGLTVVSLLLLALAAALYRSQRRLLRMQGQLRHLAATDELTDVLNRRALGAEAERELLRARRTGRPMAVLALDLDHFKRINDAHGHAEGDRVLRECSARWQTVLRAHDRLGRLGGEEFCVVLPETDADAARQVAERLRVTLAELPLRTLGRAVTTSIGLSLVAATDTRWDDALERADRALYQAKASGRNCVREQLA